MSNDKNELPSVYTPNDKKRIALLSGAVGQSNRLSIKGQIVDIPVSQEQKKEEWHHFHGLPESLQDEIQPLQDFSMSVVRRPRLQIEILNVLPQNIASHTIKKSDIVYTSKEFTAGDDSFFTHQLKQILQPGQYVVQVILRGIDSLRQSVSDLAYVRHGDSLILKKDITIGFGKLLVLADDYCGYIITSDIDQTFLDTPMHSKRGLVETLFQKPDAKLPIPGMPAFYQELQKSSHILTQGQDVIPTMFISASPHFFRRSLSVVFENHNVDIHALHLKYLVSTIDNIIQKIKDATLNFNEFLSGGVSDAVDRSVKFIGSSLATLFDQIAYKLTILLENRLMQPTHAKEILLGDNTEGDYFIFVLYQYLLLGKITGKELESYLYNLNFQDKEVLTRDIAKKMVTLTEKNLKIHGKINSVEAVWINQSIEKPTTPEMQNIVFESLPQSLQKEFKKDKTIKKPVNCYTGVGFSLQARESGFLEETQIETIIKETQNKTYQEKKINKTIIKKIIADFPYEKSSEANLSITKD